MSSLGVFFGSLLFLFFCCFVSGQVSVLSVSFRGVSPHALQELVVDDVTVTYSVDPTVLNTPVSINDYQVIVVFRSPINGAVEADVESNLLDFSNAGGKVYLVARYEDVLSMEGFFLNLVGSTAYYEDCSGGVGTIFSSEPACAPLLTGVKDVVGSSLYYRYFSELNFLDDLSFCFATGSEAKSCISSDAGNAFVTARSMSNGGGIYFIADIQTDDDTPTYTLSSVFAITYNNLLVAAGANLRVENIPETKILFSTVGYPGSPYFTTNGIMDLITPSTVDVTQVASYNSPVESCDLEGYNMIIVDISFVVTPEAFECIEAFAIGGGTVLVTSSAIGSLSPTPFYGAQSYNCDVLRDNGIMDPFPSDGACDALLNGGFSDLRSVDPEQNYPGDDYHMVYTLCIDPTTLNLGTPCFSVDTDSYSDLAQWVAISYESEGTIVYVDYFLDFAIVDKNIFLSEIFQIAYKNLIVHSSSNECDSRDCASPHLPVPTADAEWALYYPGCIQWLPSKMPEPFIAAITLVNTDGSYSVVIASDVNRLDARYEWPAIYGIIPGGVRIEYSFASADVVAGPEFNLNPSSHASAALNSCIQ